MACRPVLRTTSRSRSIPEGADVALLAGVRLLAGSPIMPPPEEGDRCVMVVVVGGELLIFISIYCGGQLSRGWCPRNEERGVSWYLLAEDGGIGKESSQDWAMCS